MFFFRKYFTRFASVIILIIYSAQIILKAGIFVYYVVNKNVISKNLCINRNNPKSCCKGTCQLKKWLDKTEDSSQFEKDKKIPTLPYTLWLKTQEFNIQSLGFLDFSLPTKIILFSIKQTLAICKGFYSIPLKPPIQ